MYVVNSRLDYDKRLDRGKSYANTGKVRHLVIEDPGKVNAIVVGQCGLYSESHASIGVELYVMYLSRYVTH